MFKRLIFLTTFVLVFTFAFCPMAMAADIAISTQAGWFGQAAADREMQEIADNVTAVSVERFTADQQDALADWVVAHTGDGEADLLILCGQFPDTIYPGGNAQPDGSLAELFLDDGNCIINTGDYMFYVNSAGANNAAGGLENMMDIPGISMWDDNTPANVTAEGRAVAPSLQDFQTDRPFHLDELEGDWVPELILAQNDAGTRADPVIVVNTVTGGRLGIFYQTSGQDDDPRGEVISEWINNFALTGGQIPSSPAWKPVPQDGAIDVDAAALEWTAGYAAVSHKVYLSTDATIDEADLAAETEMAMNFADLTPGTTYYWRVDEVDADGNVVEGDVWSFSTLPLEAHFPSPADGATNAISVELSWTPGKDTIMHNVNYGTDPAALLPVSMMQMGTSYDPGALDLDTTYYWRVDEFTPAGTITGPVWSFSTIGPVTPVDIPDLVAMYPLTEDASSLGALDVSGNDNHGALIGDLAFVDDPVMGQVLSLPGGSNQFVDIGAVGISGNMPKTIMCWAKADHTNIPDWTLIFGFTGQADGSGGNGSHFNIGSLGGPGGVGAHCWGWEETIFSDTKALDWHHYAMTYDGTTIRYYGDGQLMDTDVGKSNVQDLSASGDRVHIGSRVTQDSSFPGRVSDARIYSRVLTDEEIRQIGSDVTLPWSPDPADGASEIDASAIFAWNPGDGAVEQDVYVGNDADAVAAADATDTTGIYRGRQVETTYALQDVSWGMTNYWRADQVAADGSIVVGPVWSFGVVDFVSMDVWEAAATDAGAAYIDTYVKDDLYDIGTYGGEQTYEFIVLSNPDETEASMCLIGRRTFGDTEVGLKYEQWNNTGTYGATVFGVVDLDYGVATNPGVETHLVFVSSEAAATTDLYVDGALAGSIASAISLSGNVGIGYGVQAEDGSDTFDDFDGDIFGVAIYDRALTADEIAANADKYFSPIPITDPDMLIYYDFESGTGSLALDQSGHGNHGQFMGNPEWTTGIFGGCVAIDIADLDYIQTGSPLNIVSNTVTVTGWVKHDETPAGWSGILTHRGTSPGCLGLQHNGLEGPEGAELRYMWGADVYWSFSSGLLIPNGEWYFAALTIAPDQAKFYLNGIEQTATNVAEHEPTNFDSLIRVGRDHNDDRIMTSLIDEVRFYNRTLTDVDIQKLLLPDVTAPGDTVKGVPDDGDWPGGEYPALATDDDSGTKYLHFKGGAMATGFVVTPLAGPSIVTGMTFTTANDSPNRDPITFELSGSNESIDGPYELIASGDIVDFAQEAELPRFTMNATPISFENDVAYKHYQILFPTLRGPTEGLMQIAEVELLGVGVAEIVFAEDFESYAAGSDLHGQDGWKGWDNTAGAGAPASDALAASGLNSVEIIGSADLVHEFDLAGGMLEFSAMQYIPSGTTGTTYFILLNSYDDGANQDWSVQTTFDLAAGTIGFWHGGEATILYDQWVELKYIIDLDNNTVDKYYNGELIVTDQWDDNVHGTLGAIDLFGNGASSVYYDDITVARP